MCIEGMGIDYPCQAFKPFVDENAGRKERPVASQKVCTCLVLHITTQFCDHTIRLANPIHLA